MSKKCTSCGKILGEEKFYKSKLTRDKLYQRCKQCHNKWMKGYLKTEKGKKQLKKYRANPKGLYKSTCRALVSAAVACRIIPKPVHCQYPGCTGQKMEAHHYDYLKPLDVIWLCKEHHALADRIKKISKSNF